MIKRLRNRFIRIAMLSVTAVMLLLTIILNVANYVSTDSDLKQTLSLIYENEGTIPTRAFSCRTAPTRRHRRKMAAAAATSSPRRPTVRTIRRRRRPRPTTRLRGAKGHSPPKRRSPRVFSSCATPPTAR